MNFIVLDTETTNSLDDPFVYDCGWAIINEQGEVLRSHSFVNAEIFLNKELMQSAYFIDKLPKYKDDINKGIKILKTFYNIRRILREECAEFGVVAIMAHNMRFDYLACTTTQRYLTKSKYRYFFPFGVELWDTLKMARQVLSTDVEYIEFCKENEFCCANGKPRFTTEIIYRYLTNNLSFIEEHEGLADVLIEKEIFVHCIQKNPLVERKLWA